MAISEALKRVYASAPAGVFYIETLELSHSSFPRTFYINNGVKPWAFKLEDGTPIDFEPVPFQVVLPTVDGKGQQDLQILIDNVGRDAMDAIEAAALNPQETIAVVARVYLNVAGSLPQNDPPLKLTLSQIEVQKDVIAGVATRSDTLNKPFPSELYRVDKFPGMDR
jgi:hypothetical protein